MKTGLAGSWWFENLLRPVLIAVMMVCLAAPLLQGIEWLMGDWDSTYLLVFLFLAGLEGILSERVLQRRRIDGYGYIGSRAAELMILLLLLKFVNYIPGGLHRFWEDAQTWTSIEQFVSTIDLFAALVFVPLWAGAIYVSRQAMELDTDEVQVAPPQDKTSSEYYLWLTQPRPARDRELKLSWLSETFMWGGIMLLFASAVIFGLLPSVKVPALPTLLYCALGIALLSQAQFSVMSAGWRTREIPVQPGIARRWLLWAVVFLVGIALIARVLPTGYAMGPVLALYYLIVLIAQGFMVLVTLITYALGLLLSFFLPDVEQPDAPPLTMPGLPAGESPLTTNSSPWLETLLSVVFWVVILGIVGYALYRFLQDRLGLLDWDKEGEGTWWGRLLAWLRALWRKWRAGWEEVQANLARRRARLKEEKPLVARRSRLFSLRRLAPRDLVRYFYLSAAKRAARAGQPRGPGQTPYEYQADLGRRFPDLKSDLSDLTEGFVKARYSQRPVKSEDAEVVKGPWQRIKAALRRRRVARR